MNTAAKRFVVLSVSFFLCVSIPLSFVHAASPWAKETTYGAKTKGKLAFGLKNSLLGWMTPWAESGEAKYETEWVGFSAGIGGMVVNTVAGVVQLGTFFIPVDFPDVGYGLRIPDPNPKNKPVGFAKSAKKS